MEATLSLIGAEVKLKLTAWVLTNRRIRWGEIWTFLIPTSLGLALKDAPLLNRALSLPTVIVKVP